MLRFGFLGAGLVSLHISGPAAIAPTSSFNVQNQFSLRLSPVVAVGRGGRGSPHYITSKEDFGVQTCASHDLPRKWDPEIGDFVDNIDQKLNFTDGATLEGRADSGDEQSEGSTFAEPENEASFASEEARPKRRVKRYQPLGIEKLYGRIKATRIYGVLNSRGEVPGTDLAPVPRRYRDRCEDQKGWSIKEVVSKVLELNHWDDIDVILNDWVGRYNRKNFPPLIKAVTSTGALNHSVRVFNWMKNQRCYRARNDIYNSMIWLYARHQRVDGARSLHAEMQEWRCKPDVETYNALINVHGRALQWREALNLFDDMLRAEVPPSTKSYNNLINACGSSGQWERALKVYERMKKDGVAADLVTHNVILTALKVGEQYAMAIEHFESMLSWKVKPDRITLNIIISCFYNLGTYDEAIKLFNSMRNMRFDDCYPDVVTFTTVMQVYAACGQVDNAKSLFEALVGEGLVPNLITFNTLIGAYASVGMYVEALQVFKLLEKAGFEPDVISYTALMNSYSKSGKSHEAREVFDLMKRRSRRPNIVTYNTLIDAYGSAGLVTEALRLLPDMDFEDIPPNVVTICSLIAACGRSGQAQKCVDVLKAAKLRKIVLNLNAYNTAISVYMNGGMYEEAKELYDIMQHQGVAPDSITFSILIYGASKVGNVEEALSLYKEMLSMGIEASVEAYSALIHAYAQQGMAAAAQAAFTEMKQSSCSPNVFTYTSLLQAYKVAGMPELAAAVLEDMESSCIKPDAVACSSLFSIFNESGKIEKTLRLWSNLRKDVILNEVAYTQLFIACSIKKDWRTALEIFEDMRHAGVSPTSRLGNHLLTCLGTSGKVQHLMKVYKQLKDLGMVSDRQSYDILISSFSRAQNWRKCIEILSWYKSENFEPSLETFKMVLQCLEKMCLWTQYLEVYYQMLSSRCYPDFVVSQSVLDALRNTGQRSEAEEFQPTVKLLKKEEVRTLKKAIQVSNTCVKRREKSRS
ncbi:protein MpPPR_32 [Marchantia polymorpha subsp. ruderalis]|uniref:PROP1-like PPR domain-containing protein n=2 Tax=Marchantia polymorpha TaxID=3197 RepID=A0AAF6AMH3_MARPO|nr:hypothetical protein MARPO_0043s0117 [Marchantia polymorpha]BBM97643.1 hypothetical protein Mp_1g07240 [Marchantia polymorpha subsp. ruderalis]|eukprot:PTQ39885.1 hypothetical protein MARPO_0043s0117 [Marchantia polymorpha]